MTTKSAQRAYRFHEINGPISPYRDSFIYTLEMQGFNRRSFQCQLRIIARFSDWLLSQNVKASDISPEHQNQFYICKQWQHIRRDGYAISVRRVLDHLRDLGVIPAYQPLAASGSSINSVSAS